MTGSCVCWEFSSAAATPALKRDNRLDITEAGLLRSLLGGDANLSTARKRWPEPPDSWLETRFKVKRPQPEGKCCRTSFLAGKVQTETEIDRAFHEATKQWSDDGCACGLPIAPSHISQVARPRNSARMILHLALSENAQLPISEVLVRNRKKPQPRRATIMISRLALARQALTTPSVLAQARPCLPAIELGSLRLLRCPNLKLDLVSRLGQVQALAGTLRDETDMIVVRVNSERAPRKRIAGFGSHPRNSPSLAP